MNSAHWQFDAQLLKACESEWPWPLATVCRVLRLLPRWEDGISPVINLFERILKHLLYLSVAEYSYGRYHARKPANYLFNRAFRGNPTCGSMLEGLRELLPYLAGYQDLMYQPELAAMYIREHQALAKEILEPLNELRIKWSHANDHVQYQPPTLTDFLTFRDLLSDLLHQLRFLSQGKLVYSEGLRNIDGVLSAQCYLLEGPVTPFECHWYDVIQPPLSHQVGLYFAETLKVLPLYPFYVARPIASGQFALHSLAQISKNRCKWDPKLEDSEESDRAYCYYMERMTLPEREPLEATESGQPETGGWGQGEDPELASDLLNSDPGSFSPALSPSFRNATWRMFASDWELSSSSIVNHEHYDALCQGPNYLSVWHYLDSEPAYLVGVRPELWPGLLQRFPDARYLTGGCPEGCRELFAPERRGHWHHNHYQWFFIASQQRLGELLSYLDRPWRNT